MFEDTKILNSYYIKLSNIKFNIASYFDFKINKGNIQLKKYKNIHEGNRCFIIGNGPSLKINDLEKLSGEYTMAANRIFTIYDETDFRPTYYFFQDQTGISKNIDEIIDLYGVKFIRAMGKKVYSHESFNKIYVNNFNYINNKEPRFSNDITKSVFDGYTVTYSMIQFACYMGFKEIYLLGIDFNYSFSNGNIDINSYFSDKVFTSDKTGGNPDLEYNLRAFKVARKYCDKKEIKIYNATRGGKLEVFERVDFDSIV